MDFRYVKCLGCEGNVRLDETIEMLDQNGKVMGRIHAHPLANKTFDNPCRTRALGLPTKLRRLSSPKRPAYASI